MRVYYWKGPPKNFGDQITRFVLDKFEVKHSWSAVADADLLLVGSVLEHLPPNWGGTICGAGKMFPDTHTDLSSANVVALRGKLTLANVDLPPGAKPVLGDPGLLVSEFVRQPRARFDLGIVPHWSDTELAARFPYAHVIDVRGNVQDVVTQIASCKRIVSSSLHGLIVADAYGIPRRAELFERAVKEGGDFKFRDYASLYDGNPHFGEFWTAPHDRVERIQRDLRTALGKVMDRPSAGEVAAPKRRKRRPCHRKPQISLLVPFRDDGEHRSRTWEWLRRYWKANLASVEVVMGHDSYFPFSKSAAVNDAASRARGRTFVVLDADAYLDTQAVQDCADMLDWARQERRRTWFMPYDVLYRLNEDTTLRLLRDNPERPYNLPSPIPSDWLEAEPTPYGHQHGAMIQIMPREAFFAAGGMDPRFRGWGSEDAAFMRAVDTLWGPHELLRNDLAHFWHLRPGHDVMTRQWVGQSFGAPNSRLAERYAQATGEPAFMQGLVSERARPRPQRFIGPR